MLNSLRITNIRMKTPAGELLFLGLFGLCSSLFKKHYYVNINKNWDDAQTYCRNYYDDLSTVSGPDLQTLSTNPEIINDWYSIGLRKDSSQNIWKWSDAEETVINWGNGEPGALTYGCGCGYAPFSKVYDCSCYNSRPFYCMEVYELVLVKQESTWEEALDYCRQHYIDLAILSSEVIMADAKINSTEAQTDVVWTGLRFSSGQWFWVNGEDLQYKAWAVGEELHCPAINQRCGVYHRQEMVWKAEDCEKKLNFLCVKRKTYF